MPQLTRLGDLRFLVQNVIVAIEIQFGFELNFRLLRISFRDKYEISHYHNMTIL